MLIKELKESIENGTKESTIPNELIEVFNDELPEGLKYVQVDSSHLSIDMNKTKQTYLVDEEANKEWFEKYKDYIKKPVDVLEIARLTQTTLKIKAKQIQFNNEEIDPSLIVRNVYSNEKIKFEQYIRPQELPSICLKFSDQRDDSVNIDLHLQMQPCDNIEQYVYSNIEQKEVIDITMVLASRFSRSGSNKYSLNFTINDKNASDMKEVLKAYKLYDALLNKRLAINDILFDYSNEDDKEKRESINLNLQLYKKICEIEKLFDVHFDPAIETAAEDFSYINELYACLIDKKPYLRNKIVKSIPITKSQYEMMNCKDKGNHEFALSTNGTLKLTLFGCDLKVYYIEIFTPMKIKEVQEKDADNVVVFFDVVKENYKSICMMYLNQDEMDKKIMEKDFIENIIKLAD